MNLVFFTHPNFASHQSMPRFATMLADGMIARGHNVAIWSPKAVTIRLPVPKGLKKWLGYIDQYILFPLKVRRMLNGSHHETLYVFTDNALGPWVPLVNGLNHVIHCHDFLAQRSALGQIPENPTHWSGRQYQAFIRRGYSKGKNFISVSSKTKADLEQLILSKPTRSQVVYNGLNQSFKLVDINEARGALGKRLGLDLLKGYLLHVGGNQWYKNRQGIIEMYNAWRSLGSNNLPLLLIGEPPTSELLQMQIQSPFKSDIHFLSGVEDHFVRIAYSGASVFLFPSLAEGFGWPIAEAMASGSPVITTNEAPMTEVAGDAGYLIPRRPNTESAIESWAKEAAEVINLVVNLSPEERSSAVAKGLENAKRFDTNLSLNRIETIYKEILNEKD